MASSPSIRTWCAQSRPGANLIRLEQIGWAVRFRELAGIPAWTLPANDPSSTGIGTSTFHGNINLAIVGCGGMGTRHLRGLAELQKHGLSEFNLVALCDPVLDNANLLADEAAKRFGARPAVVPALAELATHGVQAVDITTTPRYHHTLAVEALELGWHVMCEKPVGLTVECCRRIREAQRRTGRVLSVAENYRRDPMNRLARAVLASGAIGNRVS